MPQPEGHKQLYFNILKNEIRQKKMGDYHLEMTNDDIIDLEIDLKLGKSTLERIFDKDTTKENYYPRIKTRNKLAKYIGYENYKDFVEKAKLPKNLKPIPKATNQIIPIPNLSQEQPSLYQKCLLQK